MINKHLIASQIIYLKKNLTYESLFENNVTKTIREKMNIINELKMMINITIITIIRKMTKSNYN